ncbi:MAG: hypothetical protein GXP48_02170 [Acidobacteria bacterium]|nr:hypothetical protein [Acidobacteriota bacterium]
MPRPPVIAPFLAFLLGVAALAAGQTPHMDPSRVPGSCMACHMGHGVSGSPMLSEPVDAVCLRCHGTLSDRNRMIMEGLLAGDATPLSLSSVLAQPYTHPLDASATSAETASTATCTSCHAPHRGFEGAGNQPAGIPKRSPKNPNRFEYQLCEGCHGSAGATTTSVSDISRLFYPGNASYHPVEAPANDSSPSVIASLRGKQISCTDCHGNSNPAGPRGPHGSAVQYILRLNYVTTDGPESPNAYALCYACHDRKKVLDSTAFPEHGEHIVKIGASCATCHNPHGSVINRALIRFGEETIISGVAPSPSTGRLAFVSTGPGSGACYLLCHGKDHGPATYGSVSLQRLQRRMAPGPSRVPAETTLPSRRVLRGSGVSPRKHNPQDDTEPHGRPPVHAPAPVRHQAPQE